MKMNFLRRAWALILTLTLALSLAVPAGAVEGTTIVLDPSKLELKIGEGAPISATVWPQDADNKVITWESMNPAVATVQGGYVQAISPGKTSVRASLSNGVVAWCEVTVEKQAVTGITLNPKTLTLAPNERQQLTANVEPANATNQKLIWRSSNTSVATVNDNGYVTAASNAGQTGTATATITVYSDEDPNIKQECVVTVSNVAVQTVDILVGDTKKTALDLELDHSETLTARILPTNATNQEVQWSSSDSSTVSVTPDIGPSTRIVALKEGSSTITATVNGKTATCNVTVTAREVSSITLNRHNETIEVGKPLTITATPLPSNAKDRTVVWDILKSVPNGVVKITGPTTDNPDNKTVEVTGTAVGTATIRAKTNNGVYADCKITVTDKMAIGAEWIEPPEASMTIGNEQTLKLKIDPPDAAVKEITWHTSNSGRVAFVSGNNTVASTTTTKISKEKDKEGTTSVDIKAISAGYVYITAYAGDKAIATCNIDVQSEPILIDASKLALSKTTMELFKGRSERISVIFSPPNATNKKIDNWESSKPDVVTISGGVVTGVSAGEAEVWAVLNEKDSNGKNLTTPHCKVTVKDTLPDGFVSSLTLNPKRMTIQVNKTRLIGATVKPDDATNKAIIWRSKDESIATVSEDGTVTGVKVGDTTIVATTVGVDGFGNPIEKECAVIVVASGAENPEEESGITVTSKNSNIMAVKGTIQLEALVTSSLVKSKEVNWESNDTSVATVDANGKVTAVSPGTAQITAVSKENAEIKSNPYVVEVSGLVIRNSRGVSQNDKTIDLLVNHTELLSCSAYGAAKTGAVVWETDNVSIAEVRNGALMGHYPGKAAIRAYIANTKYEAKLTAQVSEDVAGVINRTLKSGETLSFSSLLSDLNSRCQSKLGGSLSYINSLRVDTDKGTLYYKHNTIETPGQGGGSEAYYRNPSDSQRAISDITFVPKTGFSGTAVIEYQGYMENGNNFAGSIRVEVQSTGDVVYNTGLNQPIAFAGEDFSAISNLKLGRPASYVTFTLPAESQGTLYFNYSTTGQFSQKVSPDTKYYAGDTKPSIDQITFVPAQDYSGTVNISYQCVDSTGASYNGRAAVHVQRASHSASGGDVEYTTGINHRVTLNASDFNDACRRVNDRPLNSIEFNALPSANEGILYYNYNESNSNYTRVRVETGTRYYRNSSPRISYITFVPAEGYSGTLTIPYTGRDSNNDAYVGNLIIQVSDSAGSVAYHTTENRAVTFRGSDFNDACHNANDTSLRYIGFTLPSSSVGTLYYNYKNSSSTGTRVSASNNYYYSGSPNLSNVTFVPKNGYTGTVRIPFSGYDTRGSRFSGTVQITVGPSGSSGSTQIYYAGSSLPIYWESWDFQRACQSMLGGTLSHIRLNSLPDSSCGRLYVNYTDISATGSLANTTTDYTVSGSPEIGQLVFLAKAGYEGEINIPYTGYDTRGRSYTGTVIIEVNNVFSPSTFSDLYGWDWARPSIEFLRQNGITTGYSDGTFGPGRRISRGEFALMVCRAFRFQTADTQSTFPDVQAGSSYAGAVAAAQRMGIVQGDGGLFRPDDAITRQSAMTMICRAMTAAGRAVPNAPTSVLQNYNDGGTVSPYARSSVAALIQMGAVRGNDALQIKPVTAISRAEMAVILHRVLTV